MKAHEDDPITIGNRPSGDPVAALGARLEALPKNPMTARILRKAEAAPAVEGEDGWQERVDAQPRRMTGRG
jgi:hypothetical protein